MHAAAAVAAVVVLGLFARAAGRRTDGRVEHWTHTHMQGRKPPLSLAAGESCPRTFAVPTPQLHANEIGCLARMDGLAMRVQPCAATLKRMTDVGDCERRVNSASLSYWTVSIRALRAVALSLFLSRAPGRDLLISNLPSLNVNVLFELRNLITTTWT